MSVVLDFGIRTSLYVKTVHLVGSWDNYQRQLSLKTDFRRQDGVWRGVFQFQDSCVAPGSRYWYYYVLDGCHVVHDPSRMATVEPTTGRTLNILDTPPASPASSGCSSKRLSINVSVARGRALSPDKIVSPKPIKPHESKRIIEGHYSNDEDWMSDYDDRRGSYSRSSSRSSATSIADSAVPSLTSCTTSSLSTRSGGMSGCTCQRFGITRTGTRVKLDCGGVVCGSSDDASSLCSDDDLPLTPQTYGPGLKIDTSVRVREDGNGSTPVSSSGVLGAGEELKSGSVRLGSHYSGPLRVSDVRRRW